MEGARVRGEVGFGAVCGGLETEGCTERGGGDGCAAARPGVDKNDLEINNLIRCCFL